MKSRNREVNIFNMSLLDILCGALGAFCFLMLSLLPYYHPPGENYQKINEEQRKLLAEVQDIKNLAERLKFTSNAEDQRQLVEKLMNQITDLENQIKQLQGQMNGLLAENGDLKEQNKKLEMEVGDLRPENERLHADNQRLMEESRRQGSELEETKADLEKKKNQLEMKQPWLVTVSANRAGAALSCCIIEDRIAATGGARQPPFDPSTKIHRGWWPGDHIFSLPNGAVQMSAERGRGSVGKFYVNLQEAASQTIPVGVSGHIVGVTPVPIAIAPFVLTRQRPWTLVGTFVTNDQMGVEFKEATAAERDQEWRRITKTEPPDVAAEPPGPAQSGAAQVLIGRDAASQTRVRDFTRAYISAKTDAEKNAAFEKALKDAADDRERDAIREIMSRLSRLPQRPATEQKN